MYNNNNNKIYNLYDINVIDKTKLELDSLAIETVSKFKPKHNIQQTFLNKEKEDNKIIPDDILNFNTPNIIVLKATYSDSANNFNFQDLISKISNEDTPGNKIITGNISFKNEISNSLNKETMNYNIIISYQDKNMSFIVIPKNYSININNIYIKCKDSTNNESYFNKVNIRNNISTFDNSSYIKNIDFPIITIKNCFKNINLKTPDESTEDEGRDEGAKSDATDASASSYPAIYFSDFTTINCNPWYYSIKKSETDTDLVINIKKFYNVLSKSDQKDTKIYNFIMKYNIPYLFYKIQNIKLDTDEINSIFTKLINLYETFQEEGSSSGTATISKQGNNITFTTSFPILIDFLKKIYSYSPSSPRCPSPAPCPAPFSAAICNNPNRIYKEFSHIICQYSKYKCTYINQNLESNPDQQLGFILNNKIYNYETELLLEHINNDDMNDNKIEFAQYILNQPEYFNNKLMRYFIFTYKKKNPINDKSEPMYLKWIKFLNDEKMKKMKEMKEIKKKTIKKS
tara:strand:+ start:42 stop:1589 length:1548 start_codon:yes stop_codon:yes gene_type:complete